MFFSPKMQQVRELSLDGSRGDPERSVPISDLKLRPREADSIARRAREAARTLVVDWDGGYGGYGVTVDGRKIWSARRGVLKAGPWRHLGTYERIVDETGKLPPNRHRIVVFLPRP